MKAPNLGSFSIRVYSLLLDINFHQRALISLDLIARMDFVIGSGFCCSVELGGVRAVWFLLSVELGGVAAPLPLVLVCAVCLVPSTRRCCLLPSGFAALLS